MISTIVTVLKRLLTSLTAWIFGRPQLNTPSHVLCLDSAFVQHWHPRYDLTERDEPEYRKLIERTHDDLAAFGTLSIQTFTAILEWKSARVKGRIDWTAFSAYAEALRAARGAADDAKMQLLVALPGIGAPVASTLLHFLHPATFPIIDRRTVDVLHHAEHLQHSGTDTQQYPRFRQAVLALRDDLAPLDLREIDRALFAYHKQHPEIFGSLSGRATTRKPKSHSAPHGSTTNDPKRTSQTDQTDRDLGPVGSGADVTTQVKATIRGLGRMALT